MGARLFRVAPHRKTPVAIRVRYDVIEGSFKTLEEADAAAVALASELTGEIPDDSAVCIIRTLTGELIDGVYPNNCGRF